MRKRVRKVRKREGGEEEKEGEEKKEEEQGMKRHRGRANPPSAPPHLSESPPKMPPTSTPAM